MSELLREGVELFIRYKSEWFDCVRLFKCRNSDFCFVAVKVLPLLLSTITRELIGVNA